MAETGAEGWPKARRLLRRPEIRAVYEQGMRRSSPHFTLFGLAQSAPEARFGITVSRKLGGAVERNRIRRRTRELLRRHCLGLASGCAVVVNPRPAVAHAEFAALAAELGEQLQKLGAAIAQRGAPRVEAKPA